MVDICISSVPFEELLIKYISNKMPNGPVSIIFIGSLSSFPSVDHFLPHNFNVLLQ